MDSFELIQTLLERFGATWELQCSQEVSKAVVKYIVAKLESVSKAQIDQPLLPTMDGIYLGRVHRKAGAYAACPP